MITEGQINSNECYGMKSTSHAGTVFQLRLDLHKDHYSFSKPSETHYSIEYPDDVIKWKHFPRYWPFVRGIHRSSVNSPHKGQWRGDLVFSLICAWINGWVNNREAGYLGRHRAHYDGIVMLS